jgi:hypothetical protein
LWQGICSARCCVRAQLPESSGLWVTLVLCRCLHVHRNMSSVDTVCLSGSTSLLSHYPCSSHRDKQYWGCSLFVALMFPTQCT